MAHVTYVGQVLEDGHLSLSPAATRALELRPGDRLHVTVARSAVRAGPIDFAALESLNRTELQRIANFRFPRRLQQRMERLLVKNRDGTLTSNERVEMERLSHESLIQCARRAQARFLLAP